MGRLTATLGFRAHSGWAAMVAVAGGKAILRERIEMATGEGFRARQPYHAAEEMTLPEAQAFLRQTEKAAIAMAATALKAVVARLAAKGCSVKGAAVLLGSGKQLPELPKILAAHPLIHTAEGVFYRDVLLRACEVIKLPVTGIRESEVVERSAASQEHLTAMGKPLGRPWTQDEKLSAAAALSIS
jgi:hypothetical protein